MDTAREEKNNHLARNFKVVPEGCDVLRVDVLLPFRSSVGQIKCS